MISPFFPIAVDIDVEKVRNKKPKLKKYIYLRTKISVAGAKVLAETDFDIFFLCDVYLNKLNEIKNGEMEKFLNDLTLQLSAQRALVISINICIDIGAHILSLNGNGKPETYSEIFENLAKLGIIETKIKEDLINLVKFRNLMGHLYMDINNEKVWDVIQNDLDIFTLFRKIIYSKFKKHLVNSED